MQAQCRERGSLQVGRWVGQFGSLGSTGAPCDPGGVAVDAQVHLIAAPKEGIRTLQGTYAGLSDPHFALHAYNLALTLHT